MNRFITFGKQAIHRIQIKRNQPVNRAISTKPGEVFGWRGASKKEELVDEQNNLKPGLNGGVFIEKGNCEKTVDAAKLWAITRPHRLQQEYQKGTEDPEPQTFALALVRRRPNSGQLPYVMAKLADTIVPGTDIDDSENVYGAQTPTIGPFSLSHYEAHVIEASSVEELHEKASALHKSSLEEPSHSKKL